MSGWNLPPGCSTADIERAAGADITPLEEAVQLLLEDAGVPATYCDRIADIIHEYEITRLYPQDES